MRLGNRHRCFFLIGALVAGLAVAGSALAFQGLPKEKLIKLKKKPVEEGTLRPGFGISEDPPEEAWVARLGKRELWFLDLDGDERIRSGDDGFAIKGIPFYVRVPKVLLLPQGEFRVRVDTRAGKLGLTPRTLELDSKLIQKAAVLTELRMGVGLQPVRIDPEACKHCEYHIDYLKENGMTDGAAGLAAYDEDPAKTGYTKEGAAAAKSGNLGFKKSDYGKAVEEWYAQAWHGVPMVDPTLHTVGVGLKHGVAMFYPYEHEGFQEVSYLHPPDGTVDVPRKFAAKGELPDPVPDLEGKKMGCGCGYPIHIRLAGDLVDKKLVEAKLFDASGTAVPGESSCPQAPATSEWESNSYCAFFIPHAPLAARMRHRAEFTFEGLEKPITWEFTTGK